MSIDVVVGPLHCRSITFLSSDYLRKTRPLDTTPRFLSSRSHTAHAARGGNCCARARTA